MVFAIQVQAEKQYLFIYETFAMLSKSELREIELSDPKALCSKSSVIVRVYVPPDNQYGYL